MCRFLLLVSLIFCLNDSVLSQDVRFLDNGLASVQVERRVDGDRAAFVLQEITGDGGSARFSFSPIWQVDLRRLFPAGDGLMHLAPDVLLPDTDMLTRGVLELDSSQVVWGAANDTLLTLVWRNVPLGQDTLSVRVRIVLSPAANGPGMNLECKLTGEGQLAIHSVRFPLLAVAPFGDQSDDLLAFPFSGGRLLRNPISVHHNWQDSTTSMSSIRWNYPATMQQQFLYYYDGEAAPMGVYIAAHDARGTFKRLYFAPDAAGSRLLMTLRHFNIADPDGDIRAAYRSFSLRDDYGYGCRIAILRGDWQRAADVYRAAMLAQPAAFDVQNGFLRQGKLYDRTDMPQTTKETFLMMQHKVTAWPEAVDISEDPDDGVISDLERAVAIVRFLSRDVPHLKVVDIINNYLGGGEPGLIPTNDIGLTGGEFRENLPEYLARLKQILGAERTLTGFNQDTGNWLRPSYVDEMDRSIIKIENYTPFPYMFAPGPVTATTTCQRSRYILGKRMEYAQEVLNSSDWLGQPGFDVMMWSGQGTHTKACYAPADPATDAALHKHFIGGGTFWSEGWRASVEEAVTTLRLARPNMVIASERGHEQLIDNTIRSGHGETWPNNDHERTLGDEMPNSQPVPINAYLWHDYAPLLANKTSGYYPRGQMANPPHRRLELVQDFLAGNMLTIPVGAPGANGFAPEDYGAPSELLPDRLLDLNFLRVLIHARAQFPQFLLYGKFMHAPQLQTDKIGMPFEIDGKGQIVQAPMVWASALQAPVNWHDAPAADAGAVALFFSNFTTQETAFSFAVDFSLPNLSRVVLFDTTGASDYAGSVSPAQQITLPPLSVLVAVYGGGTPTGVRGDAASQPNQFTLLQNYPNPFNPSTTIRFSLSQPNHVTLKVFDIRGRKVATLLDEKMTGGEHAVRFDAARLTSGVYVYQLSTGRYRKSKKLVLMK